MRKINRIVLHCTSGWPNQTTDSIKSGWRAIGWKNVGYHRLIGADGSIEKLAELSAVTNGVQGYNSDSVHICYKGGLKEIKAGKHIYGDTRTKAQIDAFGTAISDVLTELKKHQAIDHITIVGHRDLSKDLNGNDKIEPREWVKVCPTFDTMEEYGWLAGKAALVRMRNRKSY